MSASTDLVMRRLEGRAGEKGLAVFLTKDNSVKTTSIDTLLFVTMMKNSSDRLIGIYNSDATMEMVEEDIEWMQQNFVEQK